MLRTSVILSVLFIALTVVPGCEETPVSQNADQLQLIYSTSFEIPGDTAGWQMIGPLSNEGAPYGGSKSLLIHGGDVLGWGPIKEFPPVGADSVYFVQFFGRAIQPYVRGNVILAPERPSFIPYIRADFTDSVWRFYSFTGSFPVGTRLNLHCSALGIAGDALVDDIRVFTVKE